MRSTMASELLSFGLVTFRLVFVLSQENATDCKQWRPLGGLGGAGGTY